MKYFSEIDWRYSGTRGIFRALSHGLKEVAQLLEEADEESFDYYFDQAENMFGIAFVMAQTYITGTISDVNEIANEETKVNKDELLKEYQDNVDGLEITKVELCDAIANYFKHHDEWENWSPTARNRKTISILNTVGINRTDAYPCDKAANLMWPNNAEDLEPLLELLTEWREVVISNYVSKS